MWQRFLKNCRCFDADSSVSHKTYVIHRFERKNLSLRMGSRKFPQRWYISIDYFGSKRSILLGRYSAKVAILGAWQTYRYCRVAKTRGGTRSVKTVWLNSWSLLFFDFSNFSLINFIFQVPTILVLFLLVINVSPFASRRNETFIDHRSNFGCHSSCNRNP